MEVNASQLGEMVNKNSGSLVSFVCGPAFYLGGKANFYSMEMHIPGAVTTLMGLLLASFFCHAFFVKVLKRQPAHFGGWTFASGFGISPHLAKAFSICSA